MSESTARPEPSDRFTLLLPWYLLGTLQEAEQREVTAHLGGCERCRHDLTHLEQMRGHLAAAYADQPPPSARLKQTVLGRIAAEASSSTPAAMAEAAVAGPMDRIERWFRRLFAPRWMPALAMVLMVGQLGLLLWSLNYRAVAVPDGSETVMPRGIPPPSTRLQITFDPRATEAQMRHAVQALQGHIVDGPSPDGRYLIELFGPVADGWEDRVEQVRQRMGIIETVEREGS